MKKIQWSKKIFWTAFAFWIIESFYFGGWIWNDKAMTTGEHICDRIVMVLYLISFYLYISPILKWIENRIKSGEGENTLVLHSNNPDLLTKVYKEFVKRIEEIENDK